MAQAVTIEQEEALQVEPVALAVPTLQVVGFNIRGQAATGAGPSVYTNGMGRVLWVCRVTAVTTGGTVLVQGCEYDSGVAEDWYTIYTFTVSASGTQYCQVLADEQHMFMRTNVSARTDGTYSTKLLNTVRNGYAG